MSDLEEKAIAAFRSMLMKSNSSDLLKLWEKATQLKGGNERVVFDEMACRDIVAYTILHYVDIRNAAVFGGFIRSHFSGKPWNDMDIFSGKDDGTDFMISLVKFLCIVLCFHKHQISFHQHSPSPYGTSYDLKILSSASSSIPSSWNSSSSTQETKPIAVVIRLDLVRSSGTSLFENGFLRDRLPVTIGSCLQMQRGVVTFRSLTRIQKRVAHWSPEEIIDLLKDGKDVKLCLRKQPADNKRAIVYREYYWYRITKMNKNWTLLPADGSEPSCFDEESLVRVIERMTKEKVQRANIILDD